MQMLPLHSALCEALTQSDLFDDEGTLMPVVFPAELVSIAHARHRLGAARGSAPRFPHVRVGDDFRHDISVTAGAAAGSASTANAALMGNLERLSAGSGAVPDEVVREAWMRTAPWMHVSIPDWWAFKVRCNYNYFTFVSPIQSEHCKKCWERSSSWCCCAVQE